MGSGHGRGEGVGKGGRWRGFFEGGDRKCQNLNSFCVIEQTCLGRPVCADQSVAARHSDPRSCGLTQHKGTAQTPKRYAKSTQRLPRELPMAPKTPQRGENRPKYTPDPLGEPESVPQTPRTPQGVPKSAQRHLKDNPRASERGSKSSKDPPRTSQELPEGGPRCFKSALRASWAVRKQ